MVATNPAFPVSGGAGRSTAIAAAMGCVRGRGDPGRDRVEQFYRELVETAPDAVLVLEEGSPCHLLVNKAAVELLGYSREELSRLGPLDLLPMGDEMLGQTVFSFMDQEAAALAEASLARRREGVREQHDFRYRRRDGAELWAIVSANPLTAADGSYVGH